MATNHPVLFRNNYKKGIKLDKLRISRGFLVHIRPSLLYVFQFQNTHFMKFARIILLGAFCFLIHFTSFTQEQLGLRIDNYAGINSVLLNPANNLTSPFTWDFNLVSAGVFVENNYAYVARTNLIALLKNTNNIVSAPDITSDNQPGPNDLVLDYFDNENKRFFSFSAQAMGPSLMINLNSGHTFGIFTNARAVSNSRDIPYQLGYYNFERTPLDEPITIPQFNVAGMAWSEIGINYAYQFATDYGTIGLGANLKFLQGYEGFYVANESETTVSQLSGDTIALSAANFHFGLTDGNTDDSNDFNLNKNGSGIGLDLGAIFTIDGNEENTYFWKFGVSVIDIGKINFNNNVQRHLYQTTTTVNIPGNDYQNLANTADAYLQQLSEDILGDPTASNVGNTGFDIWLPSALSLQADYRVRSNVYVNATLVQRLPMGNIALQRDNIFAISPRFESRWLGVTMPVVLYNYQDFRVGTALRLAFLTIGSDHLGSILKKGNFTGTDFYVAVKINPFKLNWGGGSGKRGGKGVKCYDF